MYEQDIELTRLLLGKVAELNHQDAALRKELEQAGAELADTQQLREERSKFEAVLSRAAQLLDREDLQVESPATDELTERIDTLTAELDKLDQTIRSYREVVDDLESTAPELVAAARTGSSASDALPVDELDAVLDEEQSSAEPAVGELAAEATEEQPDGQAPPVIEGSEPLPVAQLFNLEELRIKETFTYGKDAAYIIDATSVLARVPRYDMHFRALNEADISDELISDIGRLSDEITGEFMVFFASQHNPATDPVKRVTVFNATGEGEAAKITVNDLMREKITELSVQDRVVCLVSGDAELADMVAGPEIYIIPLSEFFKT